MIMDSADREHFHHHEVLDIAGLETKESKRYTRKRKHLEKRKVAKVLDGDTMSA